jgi:hypothetical protein
MATKQKRAAAVAEVEVVIEEKGDRRIARVGGWELSAWQGAPDGEPRARDTDAAQRLGFGRARDIRQLIERIWPESKRPYVRGTVTRTQMPTGGVREKIVEEYWLTEPQLLKVIARARTDVAEEILDDMIRVYMLARRGLLPGRTDTVALAGLQDALLKLTETTTANSMQVSKLVEITTANQLVHQQAIADLTDRVDRLQARVLAGVYPHGLFGRARAKEILDEIHAIACLLWPDKKTKQWRQCRGKTEADARKVAKLAIGMRWEDGDAAFDGAVQLHLRERRAAAERDPEAKKRREEHRNPALFKN